MHFYEAYNLIFALFPDDGGVYEQTCVLTCDGKKGLKITTGRNAETKRTVYELKTFLNMKMGFTSIEHF